MNKVTNYKEFTEDNNAPSLFDSVLQINQENKTKILDYMRSFDADVVCPCAVYDFVEKIYTQSTLVYYTDGDYIWDEREIYHFENYDIKLDDGFVNKALKIS